MERTRLRRGGAKACRKITLARIAKGFGPRKYGGPQRVPDGRQNEGHEMQEAIKHQNLDNEFYAPEKCYITELSNTPEDPDASIARARVEPGVTTRWHRLIGTVERYYIISGRGRAEIGSLPPQEVSAGDIVLIPALCRQRITNIGSKDLLFLAICTPRFSNDVYEEIEDSPS
jgi:mannose-6-phosphate isomerase-like protein (cupin superfamily)